MAESPSAFDSNSAPFLPPTDRDYYPETARRQRITGRVELECSIDAKGSARDIVVLQSGGPRFDDAAHRLISDAHFDIPLNWAATGGPTQRFRYGVVFRLIGKPDAPPSLMTQNGT
jgi:TonB family protein